MKTSIFATMGLLSLVFGCEEAIEPGTKVDSFRVLAQAVDEPFARPGETIHLSSLSFDPEARPISWLWASCLNPVDASLQGCLAELGDDPDAASRVFAMGEGQDAVELTIPADALEDVPEEARGFAAVGVVSAACPGELSIAAGPAGLPFRCQERGSGREMGLDEMIVGIKRITLRESERNLNPEFASITFDGAPWPEDEVKEVGACDQTDFVYDTCPDAEKHRLVAALTPESFEAGTDELGEDFKEQLVVQYYATEGIFENEVRTARASQNGWVARHSASGQTLTLWFVARDNRGGVTWAQRQVRVR